MSAPMEIPPGYSIRGSGGAFGDCEQALGRARFGAMFFPDKSTAFAKARRVLRPGGTFLFNVWDRIEDNEFADCVTQTMAGLFPTDPPRFLARLPHGYSDQGAIATALSHGRCGHRPALWYGPSHWEDSGHRHRSHPRCVERMRPLKKYQDVSAPQQARPSRKPPATLAVASVSSAATMQEQQVERKVPSTYPYRKLRVDETEVATQPSPPRATWEKSRWCIRRLGPR
jgi:hypothetical protein